ncbi:MAG: metallophosphoesterase [Planctomycetes bacterium]|nr:metallophosphoesterase [Planctomycetota bacterium]
MRSTKRPPRPLANAQQNRAVRAPPTWRFPEGLGANRVTMDAVSLMVLRGNGMTRPHSYHATAMESVRELDGSPTMIGVLSDSHGESGRTRRAVEALLGEGAAHIIHCGDIEIPRCLDPLAGLRAHIVFGNNDEPAELCGYAEDLGIQVHHPAGELEFDGIRVAFTHGHIGSAIDAAIEKRVPWLFVGHSHAAMDIQIHGTRMVNPGALSRADPFSVALVCPASGLVKFLTIA